MAKIIVGAIVVLSIAAAGFTVMSGKREASPPAAVATGRELPASASPQTNNANTSATKPADSGTDAIAALRQAAETNKHLFVFIQENDDEQTRAGRKVFDAAVATLGDAVRSVAINRNSPSESAFIEKYGLKEAPMPLALAFAPNGAIAGGFFGARLTEQALLDALTTPAKQKCLKALQDTKVVLLCAQNGRTTSNEAAMKGVNEFKNDSRFAQFTEVVKLDPSDTAEKKFLVQLQLDPDATEAVTLLLAPPGTVIGEFKGATEKDALIMTLQKASSSCGPGCKPGSCSPPTKN